MTDPFQSPIFSALGERAVAADAGGSGISAIDHPFDLYEQGPRYPRFEYLTGNAGMRMVTLGVVA